MNASIIELSHSYKIYLVDDTFTDQEYNDIKKEVDFLNHCRKYQPLEDSTAVDKYGSLLAQNKDNIFLDDVYADRKFSNYLNLYKKCLDTTIFSEIQKDIFWRNFHQTIFDRTLMAVYKDAGLYGTHIDKAIFTQIFWLSDNELKGGDLYFEDFKYTVKFKNNRTVIFPSVFLHSITKINFKKQENKRVSLTTFYANQMDQNKTKDK